MQGKTVLIALLGLCAFAASLAAQDIVTRYDQDSRYYRVIVRDYLEQNRRILYFSRTRTAQTRMIIGDPITYDLAYLRTLTAGIAAHDNPEELLVVGLGGGAIPKFLSHHYPDMRMDLVEIDPDVVQVAQDYFEFEPTSSMRVFAVDGRIFLREVEKQYDVIVLDAYGADRIPFHLTTQEFFQLVDERLKPGGIVVMNLYEAFVNRFFESILATMQNQFPELYLFQSAYPLNRIAIATSEDDVITREQWVRRAEDFVGNRDFGFDLPELVEREYDRITDEQFSDQILVDDLAPVDLWRNQR
jgi:spermidine synthase